MALFVLRSVTPALIFARVDRDELMSFLDVSIEVEADPSFAPFFLLHLSQAYIPPPIIKTTTTLIPIAIPIVVDEVYRGALVVVFIGLVSFSDELELLLIVEGTLNVNGSAQTLRAELKLKAS